MALLVENMVWQIKFIVVSGVLGKRVPTWLKRSYALPECLLGFKDVLRQETPFFEG